MCPIKEQQLAEQHGRFSDGNSAHTQPNGLQLVTHTRNFTSRHHSRRTLVHCEQFRSRTRDLRRRSTADDLPFFARQRLSTHISTLLSMVYYTQTPLLTNTHVSSCPLPSSCSISKSWKHAIAPIKPLSRHAGLCCVITHQCGF